MRGGREREEEVGHPLPPPFSSQPRMERRCMHTPTRLISSSIPAGYSGEWGGVHGDNCKPFTASAKVELPKGEEQELEGRSRTARNILNLGRPTLRSCSMFYMQTSQRIVLFF